MASAKQQQQIKQLNAFMQSQQRAQAVGLSAWATPVGQTMTPAQAAQAGASPALAAQFTPGAPPVAGQPLTRQQKQAQIGANIANALKPPAPGTGKAIAAVIGTQPRPVKAQLTTRDIAVVVAKEMQKYLRTTGRQTNDFLSNLSTPGDIWTPILILVALMFVLVPVAGKDGKSHTRLIWLWMVLTGSAHVVGEVLQPLTASSAPFVNPYSVPGNQIPGQSGQTNQQKCQASGGTWQGVNETEGKCVYSSQTGSGQGGIPQTNFHGNATLTLEDYL